MKRTIRNFFIELIIYMVFIAIYMLVVSLIKGWSMDFIANYLAFTVGWIVARVAIIMFEKRKKKAKMK